MIVSGRGIFALATGVWAAVATLIAPVAAASPGEMNGTFSVRAGDHVSTWTATSACTPACTARVISSDGWRAAASLSNGQWKMSVYLGGWPRSSYPADPANCPESVDIVQISQDFNVEAATLQGIVETQTGDRCRGSRERHRESLTLIALS